MLRSPLFAPAVLIAGALTAFYGLSAVTQVAGGDWGQFQTFGYLGGIPHAPGYPLLTGSIHLATRIAGFAEPAHVANVVNAGYAVAAGVGLFVVTAVLTRSRLAGVLATVVFTTGYSVWAQATQAGTMSLQALIVVLLIGALIAYDDKPSTARFALVAFATGLSFTNHGISVFMLPATAAFVVSRRFPGIARPRTLAAAAGAFAVGLLPWIYVVRGMFVPMPRGFPEHRVLLTVEDLIRLVFDRPLSLVGGVDTVTRPIDTGGVTFLDMWPLLAKDMLRELGWGWLALAVVGWLVLARQRARLAAWIAWSGLTTIWFILAAMLMFNSARYFAVIYVLLAVCLAVAVGWLLRGVEPALRRFAPSFVRYAAVAGGLAVVVVAGLRVQQQFTGPARDNIVELREDAAEQATIGLGIMRQMAPGSVYMTNWTSSWYSRYAAIREGDRGIHIQTTDYWTMGFEQAADILASGRRLYLQRSTREYEAAYTVEPRWGVIFEVLPSEPEKTGG